MAQSLGLQQLGGGIGYVSVSAAGPSTENIGGFLIAAHADLGEVTKGITLFPEIEYFSASKDIGGGTWKVSDIAINVNAHYNLEMEGSVKPYVGAGLGFNSFGFDWTTPRIDYGFGVTSGGTYSQSYTRIGINLLVGANYKMNNQITLFLEPRYVLASDFNNFQIKVGASFALK
jgi:outer membrane protein W